MFCECDITSMSKTTAAYIILVGQRSSSYGPVRRLLTTSSGDYSWCIQRTAIPVRRLSSIRWSRWPRWTHDTTRWGSSCLSGRLALLTQTGPSPGGRGGWDAQPSPYGGQTMPNQGYGQMPGSAGGYGRGQPTPGAGWNQGQGQSHGFGNGYAGYQG